MTAPVAEKVMQKKVAASQGAKKTATSTARAGEKSASRVSRKTTKTSGPGSPKKEIAKTGAPAPEKRSRTERAVSSTKSSAERRVQSANQSRQKTKSAVQSKYRRERVIGLAEMRPKTRMLAAEFMAAIVMAIIMLFLHDGEKTYHQRMTRFFIQMTGITGIFFVLALSASSEKAARYVIPFGLLIDVSMLVYLFKQGGGKVIDQAVGSAPDNYAEVLHKEETAHGANPTLIAPGLIITPGNINTLGGTLGGPVQNPGVIVTPGNSSVLTPGTPN